jgi:predicted glycogen debranching enzyme
MKLEKDTTVLQNFDDAARHEWIETNGLGGWASSSIIGAHTRRYHGLLVAAVPPPADRFVLLSKLDDSIIAEDARYELGCNNYGDAVHPNGNQYQKSFSNNLFPEFVYEAGGILLKKTIAMLHGENTTLVLYEVLKEFQLELQPFLAVRDYHHLCRANNEVNRDCIYFNDVFHAIPYKCYPHVYIRTPQARFENHGDWYYKFEYIQEKNRGLDYIEDLYTYGKFIKTLKPGERWGIVISTANTERRDAFELLEIEKKRRKELVAAASNDELLQVPLVCRLGKGYHDRPAGSLPGHRPLR